MITVVEEMEDMEDKKNTKGSDTRVHGLCGEWGSDSRVSFSNQVFVTRLPFLFYGLLTPLSAAALSPSLLSRLLCLLPKLYFSSIRVSWNGLS